MKVIQSVHVLVFATALIFFSCKNEEKKTDIPVIEISDKAESGVLELSDVMTIDTMIALETTADNLVPGFAFLVPAGKYLLIIESGNKRMHQYDRNGKFIRFLLTAGAGPNEYTGISAYVTDTVSQIFYYSHFGDNKNINAVNMDTGEHLNRIPLPATKLKRENDIAGSALKSLFLLRDNTLACVPYNPAGLYSFFTMDVKGKFLSGIPMDSTLFRFAAQHVGTEIHFYRTGVESNADTIYTFTNTNDFKPATILHFALPDLKANEKLGWQPLLETPSKFIVSEGILSSTVTNGVTTSMRVDYKFYGVDRSGGTSFIFSNYRIGFLGGMEFPFNQSSSLGRNGNEMAVKIDAVDFREQAQAILKKEDTDPEVRVRLEKLMRELTDESNPIVLIGQLK
jgi:hypothetical protein